MKIYNFPEIPLDNPVLCQVVEEHIKTYSDIAYIYLQKVNTEILTRLLQKMASLNIQLCCWLSLRF